MESRSAKGCFRPFAAIRLCAEMRAALGAARQALRAGARSGLML
jgi:hypothetical protein